MGVQALDLFGDVLHCVCVSHSLRSEDCRRVELCSAPKPAYLLVAYPERGCCLNEARCHRRMYASLASQVCKPTARCGTKQAGRSGSECPSPMPGSTPEPWH